MLRQLRDLLIPEDDEWTRAVAGDLDGLGGRRRRLPPGAALLDDQVHPRCGDLEHEHAAGIGRHTLRLPRANQSDPPAGDERLARLVNAVAIEVFELARIGDVGCGS